MSLRRVASLVVLVVGGVSLIWLRGVRPYDRPVHPPAPVPPGRLASTGSPLVRELNAPDGDGRRDLAVLHRLLGQFTTTFPVAQLPPLGDNEDVTAALTGRNRRRLVFLPPDSPLIDAKGRLLDRWGTPYFFHAMSAETIGLRSAGPDRRLFTADDITGF